MNVRIRPVLLKKVYFFNKILTNPPGMPSFVLFGIKVLPMGIQGKY